MQGLLRQAESVTGKQGQNVRHRLRGVINREYQKVHNQVADLHDKVVELFKYGRVFSIYSCCSLTFLLHLHR